MKSLLIGKEYLGYSILKIFFLYIREVCFKNIVLRNLIYKSKFIN